MAYLLAMDAGQWDNAGMAWKQLASGRFYLDTEQPVMIRCDGCQSAIPFERDGRSITYQHSCDDPAPRIYHDSGGVAV